MKQEIDTIVEGLLEKPYWVVDLLPYQVPENSRGQFFAVEKYYLNEYYNDRPLLPLYRQFRDVLLKLNCYHDIAVSHDGENWKRNPDPEDMERWLGACLSVDPTEPSLFIMVKQENTLMMANRESTHITVYNPTDGLIDLLRQLANAEGLFVWKGNN